MAIKQLSELDDYKLSDSEQDCRGWCVVNASGTQIGTVREMLVDEERERVTVLVLDSGAQIPVNEVSLRDGEVVIANIDMTGAVGGTTSAGRPLRDGENAGFEEGNVYLDQVEADRDLLRRTT